MALREAKEIYHAEAVQEYEFAAQEANLAWQKFTGKPPAIVGSLPLIAQYGELILLGSPRGEYETDITDVLNFVHINRRGSITFKGALSKPLTVLASVTESVTRFVIEQ